MFPGPSFPLSLCAFQIPQENRWSIPGTAHHNFAQTSLSHRIFCRLWWSWTWLSIAIDTGHTHTISNILVWCKSPDRIMPSRGFLFPESFLTPSSGVNSWLFMLVAPVYSLSLDVTTWDKQCMLSTAQTQPSDLPVNSFCGCLNSPTVTYRFNFVPLYHWNRILPFCFSLSWDILCFLMLFPKAAA